MRALPLLLAGLALLAGCASPASPPAAQPLQPPAAPGSPEAPAAVPGASGFANATAPAAEASPGTLWVQKYWNGQASVPFVDATVSTFAGLSVNGAFCFCGSNTVIPAKGKIVPPGAASLEATASYTPPATMLGAAAHLEYVTPSGNDTTIDLPAGKPVKIPVAANDTEAPMQPASRWRFFVYFDANPAGADPVGTDVKLTVVAQRGPGDLPAFPMPRDPWNGTAAIALVKNATWKGDGVTFGPASGCLRALPGGCDAFPRWRPPNGTLVAQGARTIHATLTWDFPLAKPDLVVWNGAEEVTPALSSDGATQRVYDLQVPADLADSPYQARSLWFFSVTWDTQGQPVAVASGSMTFDAAALR